MADNRWIRRRAVAWLRVSLCSAVTVGLLAHGTAIAHADESDDSGSYGDCTPGYTLPSYGSTELAPPDAMQTYHLNPLNPALAQTPAPTADELRRLPTGDDVARTDPGSPQGMKARYNRYLQNTQRSGGTPMSWSEWQTGYINAFTNKETAAAFAEFLKQYWDLPVEEWQRGPRFPLSNVNANVPNHMKTAIDVSPGSSLSARQQREFVKQFRYAGKLGVSMIMMFGAKPTDSTREWIDQQIEGQRTAGGDMPAAFCSRYVPTTPDGDPFIDVPDSEAAARNQEIIERELAADDDDELPDAPDPPERDTPTPTPSSTPTTTTTSPPPPPPPPAGPVPPAPPAPPLTPRPLPLPLPGPPAPPAPAPAPPIAIPAPAPAPPPPPIAIPVPAPPPIVIPAPAPPPIAIPAPAPAPAPAPQPIPAPQQAPVPPPAPAPQPQAPVAAPAPAPRPLEPPVPARDLQAGGIDFTNLEMRYVSDGIAGQPAMQVGYQTTLGAPTLVSNTGPRNSTMSMDALKVWLALDPNVFWVNLHPLESDRIIDEQFGRTEAGKILLEADLEMKRDTARLRDSTTELGQQYWAAMQGREKCYEGRRHWIEPLPAVVHEDGDQFYILESPLVVKLGTEDSDRSPGQNCADRGQDPAVTEANLKLYQKLIMPALNERVNNDPAYADLRRVYASRVAAEWLKKRNAAKPGQFASIIGSGDISNLVHPWSSRTVWEEYVRSFNMNPPEATAKWKTGDTEWTTEMGGVAFHTVELKEVGKEEFEAKYAPAMQNAGPSIVGPLTTGDEAWFSQVVSSVPLDQVWPFTPQPWTPYTLAPPATSNPLFYLAVALPAAVWLGTGGVLFLRNRRRRAG